MFGVGDGRRGFRAPLPIDDQAADTDADQHCDQHDDTDRAGGVDDDLGIRNPGRLTLASELDDDRLLKKKPHPYARLLQDVPESASSARVRTATPVAPLG